VRTLPAFKPRRETPPRLLSFADQLGGRLRRDGTGSGVDKAGASGAMAALDPADLTGAGLNPPLTPERRELLDRAKSLLGIPYVWGGDSPRGLDCSAFVSRVWGVPRQTTDTLGKVADPITKDELQAGDAMNLPTWKDPERFGHVRLFDRWADQNKTKMWVYEETEDGIGKAVHRVVDYDPRYEPMRLRELE